MIRIEPGRYLVLNLGQLQRDMLTRVIEFYYVRWDGTQNTIRATLSDTYIKGTPGFNDQTKQDRATFLNDQLNEGWRISNSPKACLDCWNVEKAQWTTIPTWTVLSCNYMNW